MNFNLSVDEAKDVIDVYGADDLFWPPENKAAINRLVANDPEFRDYVDDAKWLEDMLANWTEGDDGAEIDLDDDDFLNPTGGGTMQPDYEDDDDVPPSPDRDEEDEDDQDDRGPGGAGAFGGLSEADEEEGDEADADRGESGGEQDPQGSNGAGNSEVEAPEDAPIIIDLDTDEIKDMDELLEDFIKKQMENADPTEFRVFTRDYDEMVDIKVPDHVSLEGIEQKVAKTTGPLQKDLRRLIAARSQVKRIPGMRNGRLHAPNLHRIMAGDDRVFTRRQEADSLDTAISLLIDCSGSMSGERTVLAAETAYAIGSVLAKLNISFECLGFTDNWSDPRVTGQTYSREVNAADKLAKIIRAIPIIMPKFKTFEERWTIPVQRRFGHVHNMSGYSGQCGYDMGSTPEGCGLEFAARRLLARKEKRKILISMTDGEPGGHVFNPRRSGDYYAYQNQSVQVVKAIEASGVDLVGVGIQHNGPARYYTNHMTIQRIEDMPKQLLGLLKRFIVG